MYKYDIAVDKSFKYSVSVVEACRKLKANHEYVLCDQYLRSSASIGANIEESVGAQSRKDFLFKMQIAYKEARESRYWLRIIQYADLIDTQESNMLYAQVDELCRILGKILSSGRNQTEH
jgi:four helix bundle protein